jgi:hypothetical protein
MLDLKVLSLETVIIGQQYRIMSLCDEQRSLDDPLGHFSGVSLTQFFVIMILCDNKHAKFYHQNDAGRQ